MSTSRHTARRPLRRRPRVRRGPAPLLIGGERPEAADGRTFETLDPATGRAIAEVAQAGAEDVDRAVAAARAAFEDGPWREASRPRERDARACCALADLVEEHADELAELESLDNGKPVKLARHVDVPLDGRAPALLRGLADEDRGRGAPGRPSRTCSATRARSRSACAAQIIPWNFPLLMAAWKVAPGAGGGLHDRAQARRADAAHRAAPRRAGARGRASPRACSTSSPATARPARRSSTTPSVDKIAFTGSTAVGREIGAKAGRALKRVTLELGGKSPNIILPDADLEAAVKGSFQAIYFNSGQACNAGSRLFVHKDQFDEVVSGARRGGREGAARARASTPRRSSGPLVSAEQQERVRGYIETGKARAPSSSTGGGRPRRRRLLRRADAVHARPTTT